MSCRYYLFPINNIYASVLYACYLFSRQIIYLFFLLWAYCNVIDSCCREIIRLRGKYRTTSEAITKSAIIAIILLILRSFQRKGLCDSGLKAKSTTFAYNNLTRDKNIQILGNQILKRMGRYDAKNKRYKPLIEE